MATRSGMPARIMLRAAVRRRSCEMRADRKFFIDQGTAASAVDRLMKGLEKVRKLADDYCVDWPRRFPREHEARTFLVVLLLLALGWPEEQMKIESPIKKTLQRVDVACLGGPFSSNPEHVVAIVETKRFREGLHYAPDQARQYASYFINCRVVVVTNGFCYKAYHRGDDGSFSTTPSAYGNLLWPRDRYPRDPDNVGGIIDLLKCLVGPVAVARP